VGSAKKVVGPVFDIILRSPHITKDAIESAISAAIFSGRIDIIQAINQVYPDILKKDRDALWTAVRNNKSELAEYLISIGTPIRGDMLSMVLDEGNLVLARLMLAAGADPNYGFPLSKAIEKGNVEVIKLLLSHGADPRYLRDSDKQKYRTLIRKYSQHEESFDYSSEDDEM